MAIAELLRWQWRGYHQYHQSRSNLLIHIFAVPLFLVGNIVLVLAALQLSWWLALIGLVAMVMAIAMQGKGHAQEVNPPEPFTGASNALGRILLEQWITFPRFVLSGNWLHMLRQTGENRQR